MPYYLSLLPAPTPCIYSLYSFIDKSTHEFHRSTDLVIASHHHLYLRNRLGLSIARLKILQRTTTIQGRTSHLPSLAIPSVSLQAHHVDIVAHGSRSSLLPLPTSLRETQKLRLRSTFLLPFLYWFMVKCGVPLQGFSLAFSRDDSFGAGCAKDIKEI